MSEWLKYFHFSELLSQFIKLRKCLYFTAIPNYFSHHIYIASADEMKFLVKVKGKHLTLTPALEFPSHFLHFLSVERSKKYSRWLSERSIWSSLVMPLEYSLYAKPVGCSFELTWEFLALHFFISNTSDLLDPENFWVSNKRNKKEQNWRKK